MANIKDIVFNISSISDVSEILPLTLWFFIAAKNKPFRYLGAFFTISFLLKMYSLVTAIFWINNMPAFHLLALLEITLVYCFYSALMIGRIYFPVLAVLILANVANTVFIQSVFTFNSLAWTFNTMVLIALGLAYFHRIYNDENDYTPLITRPAFIITAGWLIYASGSLFTYLMGTQILSGKPEGFFKNAWVFQCISNIAKNVIIAYGLWLTKKKCLN